MSDGANVGMVEVATIGRNGYREGGAQEGGDSGDRMKTSIPNLPSSPSHQS